jgi:hypothetical protein
MRTGGAYGILIRLRRILALIYRGLDVAWTFLRDVITALHPARFCVLGVLAVSVVLAVNDQAGDALIAVGEDGVTGRQAVLLMLATTAFAILVWAWARLGANLRFGVGRLASEWRTLVDYRRRFPARSHARRPFHHAKRRVRMILVIRTQAPRVLAALTFVAVSQGLLLASASANEAFGDTAATLKRLALIWLPAIAVATLLALIQRRAVSRFLARRLKAVAAAPNVANALNTAPRAAAGVARSGTLPRRHWTLLVIVSAALLGLAVAAAAAPVAVGDRLGSVAVFFLIAGGLVTAGSLLTFLSRRSGLPVVVAVAFLIVVLSGLPSHHVVRLVESSGTAADPIIARPAAVPMVETWMREVVQCDRAPQHGQFGDTVPLIVVATAGGGSRAAYWTVTVLGHLRDRVPSVSDHILAISGVSGGALGAAVFRALETASRSDAFHGSFATHGQRIIAHDFLAPTLAALFTRDLGQRLFRLPVLDRGAVIESAWEAAWRNVRGAEDDRFAGPFLDLWTGGGEPPWPALFLNGTVVETGDRIVVSNLDVAASGVRALDALALLNADMPVSTAVNNSARFPYVGPAARYAVPGTAPYFTDLGLRPAGHSPADQEPTRRRFASLRVVDGGYFENFGATTALEFLRAVRATTERCAHRRIVPVVIEITSDPAAEASSDPVSALGGLVPQIRAIPGTALATRNAHGLLALDALRRYVLDDAGGEYLRFRMCPASAGTTGNTTTPPLGWVLSRAAQAAIDKDLAEDPTNPRPSDCNAADLCRLLCLLKTAGIRHAVSKPLATGACPCLAAD